MVNCIPHKLLGIGPHSHFFSVQPPSGHAGTFLLELPTSAKAPEASEVEKAIDQECVRKGWTKPVEWMRAEGEGWCAYWFAELASARSYVMRRTNPNETLDVSFAQ